MVQVYRDIKEVAVGDCHNIAQDHLSWKKVRDCTMYVHTDL